MRVNFIFPDKLVQRIKKACAIHGVSMSEFVRQAIEEFLKNYK
jgi:metal-responsive CopG/Arc/MetJ family transcriptional regulator